MTNLKKSLLAVAAVAAMGNAVAQTSDSYSTYVVDTYTITNNNGVLIDQSTGQAFTNFRNTVDALGANDSASVLANLSLGSYANNSILKLSATKSATPIQTFTIQTGGVALSATSIDAIAEQIIFNYDGSVGEVKSSSYVYNASTTTLTITINGTTYTLGRNGANTPLARMDTFRITDQDFWNVSVTSLGNLPAHTSLNAQTGQLIADAGYVVARNGQAYTTGAAGNWQVLQAVKALDLTSASSAQIRAVAASLKPIFASDSASGNNTRVAARALYDSLMEKADAVEKAEQEAKVSKKKDNRVQRTNNTVVAAVALNILIEEFAGEMLKEEGASVAASVGGTYDKPELAIGVNVDLAKHFGEDLEGVSVNAGYSVESGHLSVGARKSWQVDEYVQASVAAQIGASGVQVGPSVMFGNNDFGIGVAMWGPLPVPQIKIFGYTASVVPGLAVANAVVGGASIAYKAVKAGQVEVVADAE